MSVQFKPDLDAFNEALSRLAELQGKTMREVVTDQAALFCRDAIRMTPPFGRTPLTESFSVQRDVGEKATDRDVRRGFRAIDSLGRYKGGKGSRSTKDNEALRKRLDKLIRANNWLLLDVVLKEMRMRWVAGVIKAPSAEIHNRMRNARGRVSKAQGNYFVPKQSAVERFAKEKQRTEGRMKAGWMWVVNGLNAIRTAKVKIPNWISRHTSEPGTFVVTDADDKFGIVGANRIPWAQKHGEKVHKEAWTARMISAQKQADKLYKAMVRKARQLKVA